MGSAAGEITRERDTNTIIMEETGPREQYYKLRRTYDPAGDIAPTDFYYMLSSAKQECLLKGAASGGNVTFQGQVPVEDEVLTATLESDIVADWLEAIGGGQLLEYVMKVFSDDLKKETLYDLYTRISDRLESLMIDMNLTSEASDDTEFHPMHWWLLEGLWIPRRTNTCTFKLGKFTTSRPINGQVLEICYRKRSVVVQLQ